MADSGNTSDDSKQKKQDSHQKSKAIIKKCAIYGTAAAVGIVAVPVVLHAAGFTGAGIAAGSLAAKAQSVVGANAVFAGLQSAGAGGIGVAGNLIIGGSSAGLAKAVRSKLSPISKMAATAKRKEEKKDDTKSG